LWENKARDALLKHALNDGERKKAGQAFDNREIYLYRDGGGTKRLTVHVKFAQGRIRRFEKYFPPHTLKALKDELKRLL
jgi:hypothetical protein